MTTEVNLMSMLRKTHSTTDDQKDKQQEAVFREKQDEQGKRYTKEPPKLIMHALKK